jgi:serine/threonine-protein kinase
VRVLAEYFDCRPVDVAAFLAQQGFSCKGGYLDGRGNANALCSNGSTNIRLCSDPFDHTFDAATGFTQLDSEAGQVNVDATGGSGDLGDVVAQGVDFRGVRYEFAPSEITGAARSISMEGVRAVMQQCGLEGNKGSCTESSIILPSGQQDLAKRDGRRFICASLTFTLSS